MASWINLLQAVALRVNLSTASCKETPDAPCVTAGGRGLRVGGDGEGEPRGHDLPMASREGPRQTPMSIFLIPAEEGKH